jgi:hypothetical protein
MRISRYRTYLQQVADSDKKTRHECESHGFNSATKPYDARIASSFPIEREAGILLELYGNAILRQERTG